MTQLAMSPQFASTGAGSVAHGFVLASAGVAPQPSAPLGCSQALASCFIGLFSDPGGRLAAIGLSQELVLFTFLEAFDGH